MLQCHVQAHSSATHIVECSEWSVAGKDPGSTVKASSSLPYIPELCWSKGIHQHSFSSLILAIFLVSSHTPTLLWYVELWWKELGYSRATSQWATVPVRNVDSTVGSHRWRFAGVMNEGPGVEWLLVGPWAQLHEEGGMCHLACWHGCWGASSHVFWRRSGMLALLRSLDSDLGWWVSDRMGWL
jgi:hypothetical protein